MSANPPLMWAQDKTRVFVTIKLQDVQNEVITFQSGHFLFKGEVRNPQILYDYTFELFDEVLPDDPETKYNKFGRYLQLNLKKKDPTVWWPRLAKTASKLHHVRIDWEKWVDDEEGLPKTRDKPKTVSNKASKESTGSTPEISESS
jgi:hypothetical protein